MEARFGTIMVALLAIGQAIAQDLRFQHLTTEDGLSDNAVTCIFEDREGYIWIGTERGLNRYDGQRLERFPPGENGPLGAHITSVTEDGLGRLWISTADAGLSVRERSGRFTHIHRDTTRADGLTSENLNQVLVVDDSLLVICSRGSGAIWFHTDRGALFRKAFRPVVVNEVGDTLYSENDDWNHSAIRLDDRRIWLSMLRGRSSYVVDARSGALLTEIPATRSVTNGLLLGDTLFMGGWAPGLQFVRLDQPEKVTHVALKEEITAIVEWRRGELMAGTKVDGLLRVGTDGRIIQRYRHQRSDAASLPSDRVSCLLRDRTGNLWVGTLNGLAIHAPEVWRFEALPLDMTWEQGGLVFHAMAQDEDGTIRISTSKGFDLVDPSTRTQRVVRLEHNGLPLEVTGLFRTAPDEWFLGTETGVFRYDALRERILTRSVCGKWDSDHAGVMFQARAVIKSAFGGREQLILGALGYGHIAVDHNTGERVDPWLDYPHEPGTLMLRATLPDACGRCWSATTGGVVRWTPAAYGNPLDGIVFSTSAAPPRRLPGDDAQALVAHGDTVWVALRDAGLASIVDGRATAYTPPPHMPHDALGATLDAKGHVWCTTSNGLLRYSPHDREWLHVPVNDGREFRQLTKCITTLKDGRIALCADDHLLIFDPASFYILPRVPAPRLVSIRNNWGELLADGSGTLELPYRNSAFDAMLTALQPIGARPLTFLYRLDTEGEAYREADARSPVRYAGVPTGAHRLLVHVRDAYGREGPETPLLTVRVTGPFWQQWWFFALLLLAGALGMYLVSRLRQRQHEKLQGVRDRIARDLHDDIGSTLGSISFYSEALRRKLSGSNDGMTQDVAEKIGSSSREMIDRMSDIVWSVDPKHDDAGALIERMQGFAKDLLSAKDIALDFRADPDLSERKLSAEQRRNLFLICKEALYNTVKYADARKVTIVVSGEGHGLTICLTDDGRGFDVENTDSYNGNGLVNMHARAEAIHAEFAVDSKPGNGVQVTLHLPPQQLVPRSGD